MHWWEESATSQVGTPLFHKACLLNLLRSCLIIYLWRLMVLKTDGFKCLRFLPLMSVRPPACVCVSWTGTYSASVVFEINLFCSSLCFYLSPYCQLSSGSWILMGMFLVPYISLQLLSTSLLITGTQCFPAQGRYCEIGSSQGFGGEWLYSWFLILLSPLMRGTLLNSQWSGCVVCPSKVWYRYCVWVLYCSYTVACNGSRFFLFVNNKKKILPFGIVNILA